MTAPLTRDQQIELMKGAEARHAARMAHWVSHLAIKDVLTKPAPGQEAEEPFYVREDTLARCG